MAFAPIPSSVQDSLPHGAISGGAVRGEGRSAVISTLDEPISVTVMRDVRGIGHKLYYVLLPRARSEAGAQLKEWDLWGPLILCLILSVTLWSGANHSQKKLVFASVFIIVWVGACIVTLNASLLDGKLSFFHSLCVLGYCLLPLDIAACVCALVPYYVAFIKVIVAVAAVHWATGASSAFIGSTVTPEKKLLAMYPVWLFYIAIAWFILLV